jgi:hypothetical protein
MLTLQLLFARAWWTGDIAGSGQAREALSGQRSKDTLRPSIQVSGANFDSPPPNGPAPPLPREAFGSFGNMEPQKGSM